MDAAYKAEFWVSIHGAEGNASDGSTVLPGGSFTPGREGFSPLMTWGELGSTPLRLDGAGGDGLFDIKLPPGAGTGPF